MGRSLHPGWVASRWDQFRPQWTWSVDSRAAALSAQVQANWSSRTSGLPLARSKGKAGKREGWGEGGKEEWRVWACEVDWRMGDPTQWNGLLPNDASENSPGLHYCLWLLFQSFYRFGFTGKKKQKRVVSRVTCRHSYLGPCCGYGPRCLATTAL